MKSFFKLSILALSAILVSCCSDSIVPDNNADFSNNEFALPLAAPLAIAKNDSVITNTDAAIYERPGGQTTGEVVPQGTAGLVVRHKTGWAQVSFINGQFGVVEEGDLDEIGDTQPPIDPPDPPPTGGSEKMIWVGFSNTRQIIVGTPPGYDIGNPDPRMSGNAIMSYGDPESRVYQEGLKVVRDQLANNPDATSIVIMMGTRYSGTDGVVREGARCEDTTEFLDAPCSGSPRYSELEMFQNIGQMLDEEAPGLKHYAVALHTYNPINTCYRKLGNYAPTVLELLVRESENRGYFDKLELNGQPWSLPVVSQAAGHISGDMCHLSAGGVDYLWQTSGGIKDLIDSLQ